MHKLRYRMDVMKVFEKDNSTIFNEYQKIERKKPTKFYASKNSNEILCIKKLLRNFMHQK